jgi:hypothetical protein
MTYNERPQPKPGPVRGLKNHAGRKGEPNDGAHSKFNSALRLNCAGPVPRVWNRHDHSRASLAFLHQQPQHGPHNQGDKTSRS